MGDVSEMGADAFISELGLDSLVAMELRNFIVKVLQTTVMIADIMDSVNLRSLAELIAQRSTLITSNQKKGTVSDARVEEINGESDGLARSGYMAS